MDMDIWYELRLRELSGLNEAAEELLREAEESRAGRAPDEDDEE